MTHIYKSATHQRSALPALHDVSLSVGRGEVCAIVGPSGSGKTTLLKLMAGLIRPTTGEVCVAGEPVVGPSSRAAVVFQEYSRSLLPWLSVAQNVELAVRAAGDSPCREAAKRDVGDYLDAVGLSGDRERYPWQLSGGMQQRVALARALASGREILLLDEPFGSLDALTRFNLEDLVLDTVRKFGLTLLLITHDVDEAVYMSDRVLLLRTGGLLSSMDGVSIALPRPRNQEVTRQHSDFINIRARLLQELGVLGIAS